MASLNGKMKFKYEDDHDGYGDPSCVESKIEPNYPIMDDSEEDYEDEGFD